MVEHIEDVARTPATGGAAAAATGRYMYAVCRGLDPAHLETIRGLRGAPLEQVAHEDLVAVVSTVDLAEFGEEGLRRNLEDLAWLEETARAHDAVVQELARTVPTAPLRLATICLDDAAVRRRLREWYVALRDVLDRIEGRAEWSVKVFTRPREASAAEISDTATGGGAAYLRRKKAEHEARVVGETAALEAATAVHHALAEHAVAGRRLPAQDPRLSGHEGTMLHNGAYLVEVADGDRFAQVVEELAEAHPDVVVDVRGPWPPYSFAMLEQA